MPDFATFAELRSEEISARLAPSAHGWKKSVKQNTAKPPRTIIATVILGESAAACWDLIKFSLR
jgi:hypothetical protein